MAKQNNPSYENVNLASMTNDAIWQEFVAAHKKMTTIEQFERLVAEIKAADAGRPKPSVEELELISFIEQITAELRIAVAARLERYAREANRRG